MPLARATVWNLEEAHKRVFENTWLTIYLVVAMIGQITLSLSPLSFAPFIQDGDSSFNSVSWYIFT